VALPEFLEQLKLIRKQICTPLDNQINWNNIVNNLEEFYNNVVNVVHLKAWATVVDDTCSIPAATVAISGFDPWYDPLDFPDIATPTEARNRKNYQTQPDVLIEIEYNRADQLWEWTGVVKVQAAVGVSIGYSGGALILSRITICVPPTCPGSASEIPLVDQEVVINTVFPGIEPGLVCTLYQEKATVKVFETTGGGGETAVIEFTPEIALQDIAHVPGEGIYGSSVVIFTPCTVAVDPELLIPTGPCATGSGSGSCS
jgi:hypothetical protein